MWVLPIVLAATTSVSALVPWQQKPYEQIPLQLDEQSNLNVDVEFVYGLDWDRAPDPDATGNFIFNTVSSLLQRWPNTVVRPGHNIVPVTMPEGTIMYHGRGRADIPDRPDWLAFDFEHAYLFARGESGHVLTFVATRPLKLIYLDGSSAAKMGDGSVDTQDVLMFHEVRNGTRGGEFNRIQALCDWGKPFGVDGFVRMEFHFELMHCDFTSAGGLKLVNSLNVLPTHSQPHGPKVPPPPGSPEKNRDRQMAAEEPPRRGPGGGFPQNPPEGWIGTLPSGSSARLAGKWHDFAPGETRVRIDYSGIVTFYDPAVRSLVKARRGRPRPEHRLLGISREEADMKIQELEEVLLREKWGGASGVDWASIHRIVIERYGQRLEVLNTTLTSDRYNTTEKAGVVRQQLLTMLVLYITRADVRARLEDPTSSAWLGPVVHRCSTTQTSSIPTGLLTKQELIIYNGVAETLHEICRRLSRAFAIAFDIEEQPEAVAKTRVARIHTEVRELMDWLDWTASWVKCKPGCAWDEMCVVPTWPFRDGYEDPADMTPRCSKLPDVTVSDDLLRL